MKTTNRQFTSLKEFYKFYYPDSLPYFRTKENKKEELGNLLAFDILNGIKEALQKGPKVKAC